MILHVFSVFDSAVGAYLQPFYTRSKGEAIRSFTEAANDEKGPFRKNAADYILYMCAVFDDSTGLFTGGGEPIRVVSANEVLYDRADTVNIDNIKLVR